MQAAGEESTVDISPQSSLFISSFWGQNVSLEKIYETSVIMTIHQQRTVAKPSPHKALATKVQIPWQSFKGFFWQTSVQPSWNMLSLSSSSDTLCSFLIDDSRRFTETTPSFWLLLQAFVRQAHLKNQVFHIQTCLASGLCQRANGRAEGRKRNGRKLCGGGRW